MYTLMLRSRNNYVTSVLLFLMLAAVCQYNSWFANDTNANCAVGERGGGSCISFGVHEL